MSCQLLLETGLGVLCQEEGDLDAALAHHEQALGIADEMGGSFIPIEIRTHYAKTCAPSGRTDLTIDMFTKAVALAQAASSAYP